MVHPCSFYLLNQPPPPVKQGRPVRSVTSCDHPHRRPALRRLRRGFVENIQCHLLFMCVSSDTCPMCWHSCRLFHRCYMHRSYPLS
uniref:Uncharacterized protein n=1 Tax=Arundo donax TaxID=35708 RepID=A0A0A8ZF95_ARUDO